MDNDTSFTDDVASRNPDLWEVVAYLFWGGIIAGLAYYRDGDAITALMWIAFGVSIRPMSSCFSRLFSSPAFNWYQQFGSDPKRDERLFELLTDDKTDT